MYVSRYAMYWVLIILLALYAVSLLRRKRLPPLVKTAVPPVIIIVLSWKDKKYYLFDILSMVGITCDDKQRKGIEDIVTKDKEELGFH
jgi:hypothetical protein